MEVDDALIGEGNIASQDYVVHDHATIAVSVLPSPSMSSASLDSDADEGDIAAVLGQSSIPIAPHDGSLEKDEHIALLKEENRRLREALLSAKLHDLPPVPLLSQEAGLIASPNLSASSLSSLDAPSDATEGTDVELPAHPGKVCGDPSAHQVSLLLSEMHSQRQADPRPDAVVSRRGWRDPAARYAYFVMAVFVALGIAMMTAFNAVISLSDYWEAVFPGGRFDFKVTVAFYSVNPFVYIAMLVFIRKLPYIAWLTASVGATVAVFLTMPVIPMLLPQTIAQIADLVLIVVTGAAYSVLGSTVMALSSVAGPAAVQGVMFGQGIAGVAIILIRIATKAVTSTGVVSDDDAAIYSAVIFFIVCAVLVAACLPLYIIHSRLPQTRRLSEAVAQDGAPTLPRLTPIEWVKRVYRIIKIQSPANFAVCTVYATTASSFPGLALSLTAGVRALDDSGWFDTILLAIFMGGDQIGRFLPKYRVFRLGGKTVLSLAALRLLFIPVYTILYVFRDHINFGLVPVALMCLFSVTNGLFSTRSFMLSSEKLPKDLSDLGGVMMTLMQVITITFANTLGLTLGYLPKV
ncbi:Equilibrative nucleoside transporter [Carpediemonas membranifera]|uniref:Equilibrative nucleoside transporter n=1 Tax=Carpediemonas membranifera TaxID=201153 RepID=A0A8J6AXU3_9EUKA|nr:Equilibrative nucleoside transporter [Carpediemonas membranifera]|eukprot:KAG9389899.1 Equilibrative nucleoside transporter [Carpediemonas membranifera]